MRQALITTHQRDLSSEEMAAAMMSDSGGRQSGTT